MSTSCTGGLPVVRPAPIVIDTVEGQGISLLSDLHHGPSNVDYALQQWELKRARRLGDRILLGGDLGDLILPGDKRYTPDVLHPRLRGRTNIQNALVDWLEEDLAPYANHIDGIGIGNHEAAALRKTYFDVVEELLKRLNARRSQSLPPIAQLGYTAYIQYRLVKTPKGAPVGRYTIWYHHGTGKSSKTHGALGRLIEQTAAFAADLYWSGHSHSRSSACEVMHHCGRNGKLTSRDVRCVVTGSYMLPYAHQSQESMAKRGRKSNYVSEGGFRPHGLGGARVVLHWEEPGFPTRVEVTQ